MGDYSVETKNRFQLILDDSDEEADVFDIIKQEEAKLEKKRNEAKLTKNVKNTKNEKKDKSKTVGQEKADNTNVTNMQNTNNKITGRNDDNRLRGRQSNDRQKTENFEKAPPSTLDSGVRGARRGGSAGFRGSRGGGRGGRGGPMRMDRHSGSERTGIKAVEKKDGSGSHNWGGEIESQLDSTTRQESQTETGERTEADGEETINTSAEDDQTKEPAEPEVQEMTLDEWKASQASSRTKQQFNVRRPGEGEDPKQWKKTVALEPRKRAESTESYEDDIQDKVEDTRSTLNKLNIQIKFSSDNNSRGGGRGGGGRGGGGRGGGERGGGERGGGERGGMERGGGERGGGERGRGGRGRGRGFGGPRTDRPPRSGGFGGRTARRGGFSSGFNQNDRPENSAPKVDNEFEFPSLGSK